MDANTNCSYYYSLLEYLIFLIIWPLMITDDWILIDAYTLQSAKTNMNVEDVFFTIARDIKQRLAESDSKPEVGLCFFFVTFYHFVADWS